MYGWNSSTTYELSGALATALENAGEGLRSRLAVLITAAGLEGERPLVYRTMSLREVGRIDP